MNSKQIIRALNALFQLDDEDRGMVLKLWNLSDSDREALIQALQPQPQGKKTTKKSSKSSASKSPRAQGLSEAVRSGLQRREPTVGGFTDDVNMGLCTAMVDDNGGEMECGQTIDNNVHHKQTDPNYHPFISPSPAHNAGGRSSSKNGSQSAVARDTPKIVPPSSPENREPEGSASSSVASSKTETESVSSATGG